MIVDTENLQMRALRTRPSFASPSPRRELNLFDARSGRRGSLDAGRDGLFQTCLMARMSAAAAQSCGRMALRPSRRATRCRRPAAIQSMPCSNIRNCDVWMASPVLTATAAPEWRRSERAVRGVRVEK
jgi:hypothetical protein